MAELMGGTLVVSSEPGKGSCFTLSVPYEPGTPVPATATETLRRVRMQVPEPALMSTADDSTTALNDGRPLVLVAEDELDNLYIMKKYLNRHGCQVVFARDGNEVLQKARKYRPIAITLDLVLPKKNGWDVLSELKTDPETRHIPVIVASVLDNQERGFCLGAYRYLVKPINETDLADTIHQIQWADRKDVKRVLIIDDNVVDSDLMARLLAESKYQVMQASRGDEGIATAARERPDLIVLDLSMPGMDGFEVMRGLKRNEETRSIPVVVYTAKDLTQDESARLRSDARRIFLKNPLEPGRMLAEIAELFESETKQSTAAVAGGDPAALDPGDTSPVAARPAGPIPPAAQAASLDDGWERAATALATAASGADVPSPSGRSLEARRILLVEDDAANQYTIEFMLKMEGYQVIVAANGRDAIEKATTLQPDIVLMDMMMPVMGGHEATKAMKDTPGVMEIPVIALTAAAMTGDREKALAAGCDDYLSKPVSRELLLERVGHWVARAREAHGESSPPDSPPPRTDEEPSE